VRTVTVPPATQTGSVRGDPSLANTRQRWLADLVANKGLGCPAAAHVGDLCFFGRPLTQRRVGEQGARVNTVFVSPCSLAASSTALSRGLPPRIAVRRTLTVFRLVRSHSSARADAGTFGRGWGDSLGEHLRYGCGATSPASGKCFISA